MDGLELVNGKASFAFNGLNGDPWHRMGTKMDGNMPLHVMLQEVGADFTAYAAPVTVVTNSGVVEVKDKLAVVAERPIGPDGEMKTQVFGIHGQGYTIVQYERVAEKALAIVGASRGDAVIDTMGLLFDGKRFFAYIDLGEVFLDPQGINDKIKRGLAIYSSHDGSVAIHYAESDVRAVCYNTISLAVSESDNKIKAKHTLKVENKLEEAEKILGFQRIWTQVLLQEAERLLRVGFTEDRFEKVLNSVFPYPKNPTERQKKNTDEQRVVVRSIFANERNAANYGRNGWTMLQAIGEYLDHHRDAKPEDRALASMQENSWVWKKKLIAQKAILSLV
jgi:phage/plasmid-like protein (TIGR03299 family)